ncbi:MAG: iron-containing alcohol dehydrogenase, partial [Chloroflexi bacterium]|nr:iron-containing alcohol dehydrogenase [Chloroflexota bacterium]
MTPSSTNGFFCLYGPPGSGKSTVGRLLAAALDLPAIDLDGEIERQAGRSIPEIFQAEGEPAFRARESACLQETLRGRPAVVSLGGGALLDAGNRAQAEAAGVVVCLNASPRALLKRLQARPGERPLLGEVEDMPQRLADLLERRGEHYASFPIQVDMGRCSPHRAVGKIQRLLGAYHVSAMGSYDVRVQPGGLDALGNMLAQRGLRGPVALVSDAHVGPLYAPRAIAALQAAGYPVHPVTIPAGELHKTLDTVQLLWQAFLEGGLERGSTVVALGGGVVGDLAGFAAATYLRGVPWVGVPTSLLSMVDSSLGGKTGADLPQGKNLIGAFHAPALVLADPALLATLPVEELRSGMGEVVKHGILADEVLFCRCATGWSALTSAGWDEIVRRAMAVKITFIEKDPY